MSSSSDRFFVMGEANGTVRGEQLLLSHHHNQPSHHNQIMYHVPQHSRREKLRTPADGSSPPLPHTSHLQLQDAVIYPPSTFYHASSMPPFLSSSSSSSSSLSCYYNQNPNYYSLADPAATHAFMDQNAQTLPASERHHPEISPQRGFSLSLSSVPRQPHHFGVRPAPLGPFTGYAAVLNRSKFLEPARKLLDEVCGAAGGGSDLCGDGEMLLGADPMEEALTDHRKNGFYSDQAEPSAPTGSQQHWKKTKLIAMLDEVYRRYKQYHQQVQDIIASFESVAGLSTAAPYASMALKIMYKNFRYLKNMISDQLCHLSKVLGNEGRSRSQDVNAFGLGSGGSSVLRPINGAVAPPIGQPHVWRPQRGLPERAVSVLRAWLFEHFLHPYPTDADKQMLAKQTGLTRNQVSNWFINARVRLWKPMVEEVHSLDMQQRQQPAKVAGGKHARQPSSSDPSHFIPEHLQVCSTAVNQPPSPPLAKSIRQEVKQTSNPTSGPVNFVYGDLSNDHHYHHHLGVNSSVSLTLGLHQNDGICLGERLPVNVARRFGLEECNDAYSLNSYSPQSQPFGKDISNHLLHDFVG